MTSASASAFSNATVSWRRALSLAFFVAAISACGGGDDEPVVTPTPARFVYATNVDGNDISAYSIDATNGSLSPIAGAPFATGVLPFQAVVGPEGKFLYVAHNGNPPYAPADGSGVAAYAINPTSGALTPVPGSPFTAGGGVSFLAFTPSGRHLYALNSGSNDITTFSVDASTGVLTPLAGPPLAVGLSPQSIAVDPSGKFALVARFGSASLSVFAINATTAALTEVAGSPFAAGGCPYRTNFGAGGKFVYVSNANGDSNPDCAVVGPDTVSAFSFDASTGSLAALAGSPLNIEAFGYAQTDSSGAFLYVPLRMGLAGFAINATTGALTELAGSPFAAGPDPTFAGIDPSGRFLYLSDCAGGSISGYAINASTGVLTLLAGAPAAAGTCPLFLATK